jgi:4-hydroxy-tetrahydrodipicolinate reductase
VKSVVIFGGGKMAEQIATAIGSSEAFSLLAIVSRSRPQWLNQQDYFPKLDQLEVAPDLLIDFTLPGGTSTAAAWCRSKLVSLISGTTGLSEEDQAALANAAEVIPVLWAPNLSRGINLLLKSVSETAASMPAHTPVEIVDVHHVHKMDSPSGTALLLARAVAVARGQELEEHLNIVDSMPHSAAQGSINCLSRREGEVIGEHHVRFHDDSEVLEFSHSAQDRNIYAAGALEAGLWLSQQPAGFYTANDWLS